VRQVQATHGVSERRSCVALGVERSTIRYRSTKTDQTMDHRRDVGRGTGGFDLAAQPIGVIGLIGEHDGVLAQMAEQLRGDRAIASLAGRQDQFERQSARIGQGVDLGRQPAAGAAHTAIRVAFFELAAC